MEKIRTRAIFPWLLVAGLSLVVLILLFIWLSGIKLSALWRR